MTFLSLGSLFAMAFPPPAERLARRRQRELQHLGPHLMRDIGLEPRTHNPTLFHHLLPPR